MQQEPAMVIRAMEPKCRKKKKKKRNLAVWQSKSRLESKTKIALSQRFTLNVQPPGGGGGGGVLSFIFIRRLGPSIYP